jgi:CarD family transcriptional regulator
MASAKTKGKSASKSGTRTAKTAKAKTDARKTVRAKSAAKEPTKSSKAATKAAAKTAAKTVKKSDAKAVTAKAAKAKAEAAKAEAAKAAALKAKKAREAAVIKDNEAKKAAQSAKSKVAKPAPKAEAAKDTKTVREVKAQKTVVAEKAPAPAKGKAQTATPAVQKAPVAPAPAASAPKADKPAVAVPPTPASPVPESKPTAMHERTEVTKKKTDQPAAVAVVAKAAPSANVAPVAKPAVKPVEAKVVAEARSAAPKSAAHRTGFKATEFIVYPAHGVGQIIAIEEQEVAGFKLELFVINFVKDKMTLKVPLPKVLGGAIRKLSEPETVKKALDTLTGRARIKRTMWSRRAQEYEAKINSGDLGSIAEVVRDLYRSDAQPEQSYSERQLYEAALDRMAREISAVNKLIETEALKLIESHLQRGPKRGAKVEASADADVEIAEGEIEEAA